MGLAITNAVRRLGRQRESKEKHKISLSVLPDDFLYEESYFFSPDRHQSSLFCTGSGPVSVCINNSEARPVSNEMDSSQYVRVAVNIRPLISSELLIGCTDCIIVVPGEPQVLRLSSFIYIQLRGSSAGDMISWSGCAWFLITKVAYFTLMQLASEDRVIFGVASLLNFCLCLIICRVQIGSHSFTYDHVYGSTGSSSSAIFNDCVAPLVDALFRGYNATVLAYGQSGSGKTYTVGINYNGEESIGGIMPEVMDTIFKRIETMRDSTEFLVRVSFFEIFKEVFDLLDQKSSIFRKCGRVRAAEAVGPARVPIQVRETVHGGMILPGLTEVEGRDRILSISELLVSCYSEYQHE